MATLAIRAIRNNSNLTGPEISFREAIAAWCENTYKPFTDKTLNFLGAFVGQKPPAASKSVAGLREKGEAALDEDGKIYLIRLDDWQLQEIARRDYPLLKKLARLGCVHAALMVIELTRDAELLKTIADKYKTVKEESAAEIAAKALKKVSYLETNVSDKETSARFLMQFFLLSSFQIGNKSCLFGNSEMKDVSYLETNVSYLETPYKDDYEFKNSNTNINNLEEEEETSSSSSEKTVREFVADSDEAQNDTPKTPEFTQETQGVESKNGKKSIAQEAQGAESDLKKDKIDRSELRSDIPPDKGKDWLKWLASLPKYAGIDMQRLHKKMLSDTRGTPSRERFLRWLLTERRDIPLIVETSEVLSADVLPDDPLDDLETLPLTDEQKENALIILRGMRRESPGGDLRSMAGFYTPEDWSWLMEKIK